MKVYSNLDIDLLNADGTASAYEFNHPVRQAIIAVMRSHYDLNFAASSIVKRDIRSRRRPKWIA